MSKATVVTLPKKYPYHEAPVSRTDIRRQFPLTCDPPVVLDQHLQEGK